MLRRVDRGTQVAVGTCMVVGPPGTGDCRSPAGDSVIWIMMAPVRMKMFVRQNRLVVPAWRWAKRGGEDKGGAFWWYKQRVGGALLRPKPGWTYSLGTKVFCLTNVTWDMFRRQSWRRWGNGQIFQK